MIKFLSILCIGVFQPLIGLSQDSLQLDLVRHFTTQQGHTMDVPTVQIFHFPYLYAFERPDDFDGTVQAYGVYNYEDIPIEGVPEWEGIQDWKLEDNPSSINHEYISFRSFAIGTDLWFAYYIAEDPESGSAKFFGRLYKLEEPGDGPNDKVYPSYSLLNDVEYEDYQTSEGISPPGILNNNGLKWISRDLNIIPFSSARDANPEEWVNLVGYNIETGNIEDGDPATFLNSIKPNQLTFVNGDTVIVTKDGKAASFSVANPAKPELVTQIEYPQYKNTTIIGKGDNYIYFRASRSNNEGEMEAKVLMIHKTTLALVNESDLNFSYQAVKITNTGTTSNEGVIEKNRDVLTFYNANYSSFNAYRMKERSSFTNSGIDSLVLVAKGSDLIPFTLGFAEKIVFNHGQIILSMSFNRGDEYPVGYGIFTISQSDRTSVSNEQDHLDLPASIQLSQNYPNPFNPTTQISYTLPKAANVQLTITNTLGQRVATLVNQPKSAGKYTVNFDASALSSGVYFYTVKADNFIETKKMLLIK